MGSSELAVGQYATVATAPTSRRAPPTRPARSGARGLGLAALASICAVIGYLLRPGALTDDTYAFLDWGRDLRHGLLPLLEHRTFQPLPIAAGAVLSLFGSAAPTITVLLCLAGLVLLAAAAWRIVALLGYGQPAPALAALLVLVTPVLPIVAFVAYNNLPFATLLLWALVFELEQRRAGAWVLLILAGLTRPEAWLFLVAYGLWTWWRADHPYAPRRWLPIAALALGPIALWAGLEWGLFGDPLYSLTSTTTPAIQSTHTNSPQAVWHTLHSNVPTAPLVASAVGALGLAFLAPRRLAATTLAAALLAALTIVVLAASSFNLPGRDFTLLVALLCVLAATGATLPARLLTNLRARLGRRSPQSTPLAALSLIAGLVGAVLVVWLPAPTYVHVLRRNFTTISVSHQTGRTLTHTLTGALPLIDVRGAPRHSVAMLGAVDNSELAWVLGVPYNVVSEKVEAQTRLIVQPSPTTWSRLMRAGLTNRTRSPLPRGWRVLLNGDWQVYAAPRGLPARLR